MRVFFALFALVAMVMIWGSWHVASAQTKVVNKIRLVNPSSGAVVIIEAPSGLSETQRFTFPVSTGAAGQLMTTSSSGSGNNPMQWATPGASATALSDRKPTTINFPDGADTALIVAVEANKSYRVEGLLQIGRSADNTPASDNLQVKLTAPTGSTRLLYGLRCYDCPAGTTGVPLRASGTTTATSGTIDPAGATTDDYTTRVYSIEGVIDVGSTAGYAVLTLVNPDPVSNSLTIGAQTYIVLTEID